MRLLFFCSKIYSASPLAKLERRVATSYQLPATADSYTLFLVFSYAKDIQDILILLFVFSYAKDIQDIQDILRKLILLFVFSYANP